MSPSSFRNLTSRVGELDSNRVRNEQHMEQVEGRLKQTAR